MSVLVANLSSLKTKKFDKFNYNNELFFYYHISISSSVILVEISPCFWKKDIKFKSYIGSFLFDLAEKFLVRSIDIRCKIPNLGDVIVFEFIQKDFIFNKYLDNNNFSKYITNHKLSKKYDNLTNCINYLKKLVSEPSNILFPESFANIAKKEINKKKINVKIFNKKQIEKIGLRCLLSVNQGSAKDPRIVTFHKKNYKKMLIFYLWVRVFVLIQGVFQLNQVRVWKI